MIVVVSASKFAALFVERHPRFASYLDTDETDEQAELLHANGLDDLNAKVLASPPGEVLDVVAEHNMAAMLVRRGFTDLEHEPTSMPRPVDFVGTHASRRCYRIEVKRLAASEHDELHSTVMRTVNMALTSNRQRIVIKMQLRDSFEASDINGLVQHVKQALRQPRIEHPYAFGTEDEVVASYTFHPSDRTHPYVGLLADMDILRDTTGVEAARVLGKMKKAYSKFKMCPTDDAVHLVTLEVDNTVYLSQVADALYGREYVMFTVKGPAGKGRYPDGAFCRSQHSRLSGVLIARRLASRLFVPYNFTLFPNPIAPLPVNELVEALGVGEVVGAGDYP